MARPIPKALAAKMARVKLFLCDVDGVLTNATVFIGDGREFKEFHIRDGLVNNGKVETEALDPIARIGGPRYARLGEMVTLRGVFQTPKSTD